MYPRLSRHPVTLAALFAAYFGLARLATALHWFSGDMVVVWPSTGLALAATVVLGRSIWPAVFGGALCAYAMAFGRLAPAMTIAIGHTFEAIVGAALIDRLAGGANVFRSARTVFRFAAIAAIGTAPISATFGVAATVLGGSATLADAGYVWMTWWLANLVAVLVITPFIIQWATEPMRWWGWLSSLEGLALAGLLIAVALLVFGGQFPADIQNYPLEFLCVPFLLWAAFRFGRRQATASVVILSGIALWGTLQGYGPFVRDSANEALVLVQAYVGVMAITGIVLAAVVAEQKHAEAQLRQLATTDPLTGLVNYRHLIEVMRAEIARSSRTRRPFAVLFIDMNGLKKINDKYGHLAGSRALCRVAEALRRSCRTIDTPARYGGDEFAVVLTETAEEGGHIVLKRVCDRLANDRDRPALSVSGGIAVFPRDGDSPTLLLRAADRALYEAKATLASARKNEMAKTEVPKTGTLF